MKKLKLQHLDNKSNSSVVVGELSTQSSAHILNKPTLPYTDWIVYYFGLVFILPIIFSLIGRKHTLIAPFVIVAVGVFLLYLLLLKRSFLAVPQTVNFSNKALKVFFALQLVSVVYANIVRYYAFNVSGIDGSIFDGLVQTILLGDIGYSPIIASYHFATHQNYVLFLLAPLYALFNSQLLLQIVCALSFWLSGIILWRIFSHYLVPFHAFVLTFCFYTLPSNQFHMFQPEVFYPLAIAWLYYVIFFTKQGSIKSWVWFVIASLFLLSLKEDAASFAIGFAAFLLINKNYKHGIMLLMMALLVGYLNLALVQPYFLAKNHVLEPDTLHFWSSWGSSNAEIIKNIFNNYEYVWSSIINTSAGWWYLYGYWLFLPLFSWFSLLVGLIELVAFMLANPDSNLYHLSAYYALPFTTIMMIGLVRVINKIDRKVAHTGGAKFVNYLWLILILLHNLFYYVRIGAVADYFSDNSNSVVAVNSDGLVSMRLAVGAWQSFYFIDLKRVQDFDAMVSDLKANHLNDKICPSNILYPHFSKLTFKNLVAWGDGRFNQAGCINLFASFGDFWPNSLQQQIDNINQALQSGKPCQQFGEFYACDFR